MVAYIYIFASEDVSMPRGDPSEDEPAPFSSASCSLTQQSLIYRVPRFCHVTPLLMEILWLPD